MGQCDDFSPIKSIGRDYREPTSSRLRDYAIIAEVAGAPWRAVTDLIVGDFFWARKRLGKRHSALLFTRRYADERVFFFAMADRFTVSLL